MKQLIDKTLEEWLEGVSSPLDEAARYALFGGGKRIRPLLTLTTAAVCGGDIEEALIPACAIECIHTYSMIHDDLPCMDDDDFRRGQPTLHRRYSEAMAVLTGDFLLTHAFEKLATSNLSAEVKSTLIALIASKSSSEGMIGGQIIDLSLEGTLPSKTFLETLHRKKTGALITAAVLSGGLVAGAPQSVLKTLEAFGDKLGLAFQIADDIIDVIDSSNKHGMATSSDVSNGKATYVSVMGLSDAIVELEATVQEAVKLTESLPYDAAPLREMVECSIPEALYVS